METARRWLVHHVGVEFVNRNKEVLEGGDFEVCGSRLLGTELGRGDSVASAVCGMWWARSERSGVVWWVGGANVR